MEQTTSTIIRKELVGIMRLNIEIPCFKFDSIDLNSRNICPFPIEELEGFEYCHYKNLEKIVDDGELDHISCKNVINFINHKELEGVYKSFSSNNFHHNHRNKTV